MWLVAALVAQAHVPRSEVVVSLQENALDTRASVPWTVQEVGSDGLVVYTAEQHAMVARRYDRLLALQWSVPLPGIVDDAPTLTLHRDDTAWAVFQRRDLAVVTRHDVETGATRAWMVPLEHRAKEIVDFETVGDDAWLVVIDSRSTIRGGLHHLDLVSGMTERVALPKSQGVIELQRLTADPTAGTVDVAYRTAEDGRFTQHVAVAAQGRLVEDVSLQIPELNLLDVQRRRLDDGQQLLVGSYADEATGIRAQGLYAARLDARGRALYVATHSFTTFDHFFDDLTPDRRRSQRRVADELRRRGEDLDVDVRFVVHDAQWHDGRLVLSGEAFVPRMGSGPRVVMIDDGGYAPMIDSATGFWFTHSVVAAFDPDGSIAWDASLPMHNVGDTELVPHVRVGLDGDVATLAYASNGELFSRVFDGGEVIEERAVKQLWHSHRAPIRSRPLTVEPWFDNQWLSWGEQRLREGGREFVIERLQSEPSLLDDRPRVRMRPVSGR